MDGPWYYCPDGIAPPPHIRRVSPIRIRQGFGPDAAKVGGIHYGGTPDWSLPWIDSGDGWFYAVAGMHPTAMLRTEAIKGLAVGDWIVPTLMRHDGTALVGYWSTRGFTVPEPFAGVIDRLRIIRDDTTYRDQHAELAVDILALNYHVSIHELGEMRALTIKTVPAILRAACGFPAVWADKMDAEVADGVSP